MAIDLSGVRAKIERAREHRDALEAEIEPVLREERDPIQLSAKLDSDSGYHVFRVAVMPDRWLLRVAVILGDIVHNLRSALDLLAWQLVLNYYGRPKTEEHRRLVKFPIEQKRSSVTSSYTYSKVSPADRADIEWAQPYYAPNFPTRFRRVPKLHTLATLHRFSNRDKHRVLNPILIRTGNILFHGTPFEGVAPADIKATRLDKSLKVGTEVAQGLYPSHVDDEVEVAGYVTPDIRLPQGGYSPVNGVDLMANAVEVVVERFAKRYGV